MARERFGSPKPSRLVCAPKKDKAEKHKPTLGKLLTDEVARNRDAGGTLRHHWNVASTLTPPFGIVTVQLFPEKELQPDDQVTVPPPVGLAVSPTEAPTGNAAMHCPGQLMPPVKLVTVPAPMGETCTVNVASEPPPGQIGLVGSSTVTVA